MKRSLTCIICPRGCTLEAEVNGKNVAVTGNSCPRGKVYAESECIAPMRTITSTVRLENRSCGMVSVKTASPVPKDRIFDVMKLIRAKTAAAPIAIGDIILKDVFGTDIIATANVK